jgi:hypothetical protein
MKRTNLRALIITLFVLAAAAGPVCAQGGSSPEAVTCRTNTTLLQSGGDWAALAVKMTMPGGIEVFTNGTFRVNEGKERRLNEGQILRADGFLLNPDGSILPVHDHIAMSAGKVMVYKDGEGTALAAALTLPDGSVINPDGTYTRPNARFARLVDGQLLTPEGVPMDGMDTITFRDGKVVIYKSGALIRLQSSNVIMGMNDGSRVRGDGFITFRNGTTTQMTEGQTLTSPGVHASW